MPLVIMTLHAYAECCYAECHYAEYHNAKCRGGKLEYLTLAKKVYAIACTTQL
jgi:hypothetical protein